jgi:hypothetical protein
MQFKTDGQNLSTQKGDTTSASEKSNSVGP